MASSNGKLNLTKIKACLAAQNSLRQMSKEELATCTLSNAQAAVVLDVDPKTLAAAKKNRMDKLDSKQSISPISLESISFIDPDPYVRYPAIELLNFLDRCAYAAQLHPLSQHKASNYPKNIAPKKLLAFQSWLTESDPGELWPFCIPKSGRPIDLVTAIELQQTHEIVEWMTIREFGRRAADAAEEDFSRRERAILEGTARKEDQASQRRL